jgi:hypothetical protein
MPSAVSQGAGRVVQTVCLAAVQLQVSPLQFFVNYWASLSYSTNRLMRQLAECDARAVWSCDTTYLHAGIHSYIPTHKHTHTHACIHTYAPWIHMCVTNTTVRAPHHKYNSYSVQYNTTNIVQNTITDHL